MIKFFPVCLILGAVVFLSGCRDVAMTPRPRAYPRVSFPERNYQDSQPSECPFVFTYPDYMEIRPTDEPCWFDLYMPSFDARLHCSYIAVKNRENFEELVRDMFVIANTINSRANYMEEKRITSNPEAGGLYLTWTGPAASPVHFFLTDTTQHFLRGALYFNARVQPDSLAPMSAFIREDIDKLIASLRWK